MNGISETNTYQVSLLCYAGYEVVGWLTFPPPLSLVPVIARCGLDQDIR
jgi:hypothetical protein